MSELFSRTHIVIMVFIALVLTAVLGAGIAGYRRDAALARDGTRTTARVVRVYTVRVKTEPRPRSERRVDYTFNVGAAMYTGTATLHNDEPDPAGTLLVTYDPSDPRNNILTRRLLKDDLSGLWGTAIATLVGTIAVVGYYRWKERARGGHATQ